MIDIDTSLHYHLQSNHFPPVSTQWIEPAKRAIANANNGESAKKVRCPITLYHYTYGMGYRMFRSRDIINALHLEFYLDEEE